jgi:hypothetical protein
MAELKEKEYFFSFQGGGWNSVYAKTYKGAMREIRKVYLKKDGTPKNPELIPLPETAKEVEKNRETYEMLLRSFY